MNRNRRYDSTAAALSMKRLLFPLMTLIVAGQLVYLFTAFDVAGAATDLIERLHATLQAKAH